MVPQVSSDSVSNFDIRVRERATMKVRTQTAECKGKKETWRIEGKGRRRAGALSSLDSPCSKVKPNNFLECCLKESE